MTEITAKVWREMDVAEILKSIDIALQVLENKPIIKNKEISEDWLKLLLDIGIRCIQTVNDQW